MSVSALEHETFSEREVARLLQVTPATLRSWLGGDDRRRVTWADFIEVGLLRQYRRKGRLPLASLREFVDVLRRCTGEARPLAHRRVFFEDRPIVLEAQDEVGLDAELCLVATVRGEAILTPTAQRFLDRVIWDGNGVAKAWRPAADPRSPVVLDPGIRFGRPAVNGISTEVLWEHEVGGESIEETAAAFDLSPAEVQWAVAYEFSSRAA